MSFLQRKFHLKKNLFCDSKQNNNYSAKALLSSPSPSLFVTSSSSSFLKSPQWSSSSFFQQRMGFAIKKLSRFVQPPPKPELPKGPFNVATDPTGNKVVWVAPPLQDEYFEVPTYNLANQQVGTAKLKREVFKAPIRTDLIHRCVVWQLAKRRQGTAKAKSRSEVRGGGRKPWNQKKTGRARAGTIRSPLWKGGGVTFAPRPRDYYYPLPKQVRKFALRSTLSAKLAQGKLIVIDDLLLETHKTKFLANILTTNEWLSCLLVDGNTKIPTNLSKASLSIKGADSLPQLGVNVYSILQREKLIISKKSLHYLQERLTHKPHFQLIAPTLQPKEQQDTVD